MNSINWQAYDDQWFQSFSNALLSLEVSKSFEPFSAPGKDGGIDGAFSGRYDGKAGSWRFQNKFHKTARKEAYNSIKREVIGEIQKLNNEDHFVILTNVAILPQEKKELLAIGNEELKRLNKSGVTFDVWDDAKIHTVYIQHPILRLWVEDGLQTAQLISYKQYFGKRLTSGIEDAGTLANEFIARSSDLEKLKQFIDSEDETIAVISGEAGIGKTRLAIEFFKSHVDALADWQALVLTTHRINLDKVAFGLSGNTNTVVLVDDAHTYEPEVIADLRNLVRLPRPKKLKFILTGQTLLIRTALELISSVEERSIRPITLSKLSPIETKELFERQENIGAYRGYIPELVTTSNGRPILIVALLRAIHEGTPIPQIKDKDVLKEYVRKYFSTVVKVTADHTGVSKLKLERLIRTICLLEPLPVSDDSLLPGLSQFVEIGVADIKYLFDELVREGLALRRYDFVISPDYYSDIMLATGDLEFVMAAIGSFPKLMSNVILNLSAVDEAYDGDHRDRLGLGPILSFYISRLEQVHATGMQDILATVSAIAYQRPDFAKLAVSFLIKRLNEADSDSLKNLMRFDIDNRSTNRKTVYGSVSWLLHDLLYRPGNEKFVFDALVSIYVSVPDMGLFQNTFGLGKRNVIGGYNFGRQESFIAFVSETVSLKPEVLFFFVDAFKNLLQLEYRVTSRDPFKDHQINITTFYLSADPVVVEFRRGVIGGLMAIYSASDNDEVRTRVIHELIDVPRAISASKRSQNPYVNVDEILRILEFIKSIAGTMPLSANREVIDRFYWIEKWGTHQSVIALIADVRKSFEPKSLTERILFLLNDAETRLGLDYKKAVLNVERKATEIFSKYDAKEIARSLAEVRGVQGNQNMQFLWAVNRALYDVYSEKAKVVYEDLLREDPDYIYYYGSYFLTSLRFRHKEVDFYWKKIEELESDGSAEALNVVLFCYMKPDESIEASDADLVERIFLSHRDNSQISFNLLMALESVRSAGYDVSRHIASLFDSCPQRSIDNFLTLNRESDQSFLKDLILNHTARLGLSFELEHAIGSLLKSQVISVDDFFDYLLLRFEIKKNEVANRNFGYYQFLPNESFDLLHAFDEDGKEALYIRALRWYIDGEFSGMEEYYAKDLPEFLQPGKSLSSSLVGSYGQEIDRATVPKHLFRLASSLAAFKNKTREQLDLVVAILRKGSNVPNLDFARLQSEAYTAIIQVGVKSGAVGEPFPADVELRGLILEWIQEHPKDSFAADFFNKVVNSLDEEIKRSTDRNEKLW